MLLTVLGELITGLARDTCSSYLQAKVFLDVLGQRTIDLVVTWHRLFLAGSRILVNVMASSVTQ
jgi:hypothetical protein